MTIGLESLVRPEGSQPRASWGSPPAAGSGRDPRLVDFVTSGATNSRAWSPLWQPRPGRSDYSCWNDYSRRRRAVGTGAGSEIPMSREHENVTNEANLGKTCSRHNMNQVFNFEKKLVLIRDLTSRERSQSRAACSWQSGDIRNSADRRPNIGERGGRRRFARAGNGLSRNPWSLMQLNRRTCRSLK